jgi:hypothetical protein
VAPALSGISWEKYYSFRADMPPFKVAMLAINAKESWLQNPEQLIAALSLLIANRQYDL